MILFNRFGTELYRQIVGIPMDTNCAPLVADLFYTATKEFIKSFIITIPIKLMFLRLLNRLPGTSMTFLYFEGMSIKIHLNYS